MKKFASLRRDGMRELGLASPMNGRAVGDVIFSFPLSRSSLGDWRISPLSGKTWRSTSSAMTAASKKNCRMGGSSRRLRPPVGGLLNSDEGMHGDDPADWREPFLGILCGGYPGRGGDPQKH